MFRFAFITLFALGCNADGYGGSSLSGGLSGSSFGGLSSYGGLDGGAIQTRRTVELKQPIASSLGAYGSQGGGYGSQGTFGSQGAYGGQGGYEQPQIIEVNPDHVPVQVHFRTSSSRVNVQQSHTPGAPAQVEHASFQDEPHRVVHEVVKPVIQEVREIIQPYRRVTQEIRPVIEEVHTVVHKGEGRRQQGGYGGGQQSKNSGGFSGSLSGNGYKAGGKARARA